MAKKNNIRDKVSYGIGRLTGQLGLTRSQAIGVMGSLAGESGIGLNTGAFNPADPGGSVGIGQWNNGKARRGPAARKNNLYAFADARAKKLGLEAKSLRKDFKTQMDFVVHELSTYEKGALGKIKSAKTVSQAARAHTTYYERPKDPRHQARAQNATYYSKLMGNEEVASIPDDESVSGANLPADTRTEAEIDASMASRPGMPPTEGSVAERARREEEGIQAAMQDTKYDAFANQPQKEGMLSLQQDERIQQAMESMVVERPAVEKQVALADEEVDEDIAIDDSITDDETTAAAPAREKDRSIFGRLSDTVNGIGEELGLTEPDEDSTAESKKSGGLLDGDTNIGGILGSIAGGIFGGPFGAVAGGLLGQGLFDGISGTTDETTGEEDGLLGGLGRSIDGYLSSVGESLGFGSDSAGSSNGGLGPDSGKRDGNFGGFAAKSAAGTGSRSGSQTGRTSLGDSEQAGNHDGGGASNSGKGGNRGESGKGGKGGKK